MWIWFTLWSEQIYVAIVIWTYVMSEQIYVIWTLFIWTIVCAYAMCVQALGNQHDVLHGPDGQYHSDDDATATHWWSDSDHWQYDSDWGLTFDNMRCWKTLSWLICRWTEFNDIGNNTIRCDFVFACCCFLKICRHFKSLSKSVLLTGFIPSEQV